MVFRIYIAMMMSCRWEQVHDFRLCVVRRNLWLNLKWRKPNGRWHRVSHGNFYTRESRIERKHRLRIFRKSFPAGLVRSCIKTNRNGRAYARGKGIMFDRDVCGRGIIHVWKRLEIHRSVPPGGFLRKIKRVTCWNGRDYGRPRAVSLEMLICDLHAFAHVAVSFD